MARTHEKVRYAPKSKAEKLTPDGGRWKLVILTLHATPSLGECQGPDYGGWPVIWLVPFICRAKAYRQSRCYIRPGRRCLPRSSRHAIRAEGSVPCLKWLPRLSPPCSWP